MPYHPTVPRVCEQCGDPFKAEPNQVARGGGRFCKRSCANRYNAAHERTEDRFWSRVDKSCCCWMYQGTIGPDGYGTFAARTRFLSAHCYSWELAHGAIPDGQCVLHRCDNRACVNPGHLFLGTNGDNVRDMVSKGRHLGVSRARLSPEQVQEVRRLHEAGEGNHVALARRFGVTHKTIGRIVRRETWGHV